VYISYIVNRFKEISELDPLELDEDYLQLPQINQNKDVVSLLQLLQKCKSGVKNCDLSNTSICHAILRDIGFIISSLRRLDIQAVEKDLELTNILLNISKTIGMVPRETSYHYGLCNPANSRIRTFTSYKDELGLINGVKIFAEGLEKILLDLIEVKNLIINDRNADIILLDKTLSDFRKVLNDAGESMKQIDPKIFSYELRPFFDQININNIAYVGPGGGQVPLLIIDNLLFGFNLPYNHVYRVFSEDGIKYLTPELKVLYQSQKTESTIVDVCNKHTNKSILTFLHEFLNELIRYRQVHYLIAKSALSKENRGNYETGSAGYRLEMVQETLSATKDAKRILTEKTK
jgi:hypothetical protein